jgi:hypothetical protein
MGHNVTAVDFSRDFVEDIEEYEDHETERLVRTVEKFDEDVRLWNVYFRSRTDTLTTPHYDGTLYRQIVGKDEFHIYYERDGDELVAVGCRKRETPYDRDLDSVARRLE